MSLSERGWISTDSWTATVTFIYTGEHISGKIREHYLESCLKQNIVSRLVSRPPPLPGGAAPTSRVRLTLTTRSPGFLRQSG